MSTTTETDGSGRARRLEAAAAGLAAALALACAIRFVALDLEIVRFPYAVNYGEGVVLDQATRIAAGRGLYGPLEEPPHVVDNYTPLFPYLASLTLPDGQASLTGGRALSFAACVGLACILYAMLVVGVRREAPEWRVILAGFAAAGLFLASGEALNWAPLYRVDCLGAALSVAGFALCASHIRRGPLLAAPLFVASLAVRQSLIAAPLAGYLAALLRDRRQGVLGVSASALLVAAGVAVGEAATNGGFLTHIVRYNVLPFDGLAIWIKYLRPFLTTKVPILAAAALAFWWLRGDKPSLPYRLFVPAALLLALTIGRKGADLNYLLIPVAALCALVSRGMVLAQHPVRRVILAALVVVQLGFSLFLERPRIGAEDLAAIGTRDRLLLQAVRQAGGRVLFEEPSLALLAGQEIDYEPFMCTQLAALGMWDPACIARDVRARRYAAIQRTAWLQKNEAGDPVVLWIGDRTVPAIHQAELEAYRPTRVDRFTRPVSPGLFEAYLLWVPGG